MKLTRQARHAIGSGGPVRVYYIPDRAAGGKVLGVVVFVLDLEKEE